MNSAEFNQRQIATVKAIDEAYGAYLEAIPKAANAERAYRRRQAIARQAVRGEPSPPRNAAEIDDRAELMAFQDGATVGDLRYQRDLDRGLMDAFKQAHRAKLQELSSLQTEGSLAKAEAGFEQTRPHDGP